MQYYNDVFFLLGDSSASEFYVPSSWPFFSTPHMKMRQSVPKRRHIKFRRQGIIQRKNTTRQNV